MEINLSEDGIIVKVDPEDAQNFFILCSCSLAVYAICIYSKNIISASNLLLILLFNKRKQCHPIIRILPSLSNNAAENDFQKLIQLTKKNKSNSISDSFSHSKEGPFSASFQIRHWFKKNLTRLSQTNKQMEINLSNLRWAVDQCMTTYHGHGHMPIILRFSKNWKLLLSDNS